MKIVGRKSRLVDAVGPGVVSFRESVQYPIGLLLRDIAAHFLNAPSLLIVPEVAGRASSIEGDSSRVPQKPIGLIAAHGQRFSAGEPANGLKTHQRSILNTDLAAVRMKAGLTQVQFADVLGASIGTVRKWESGERSPSGAAERLLRLLAAEPKVVARTLGIKALAPKRQPRSQVAAS